MGMVYYSNEKPYAWDAMGREGYFNCQRVSAVGKRLRSTDQETE